MMQDVRTVLWKEKKGLFRQGGSRTRALLTILVPVLMIAIVMPLQMGRDWLQTPWSLMASVVLPLILVGVTIPESFAGERERHTLSTLLASRLPDRAILFGKMGLAIGYGWGMTLIVLLMSAAIVNIVHWDGHIMLYKLDTFVANVTFSFLMATLIAGLGVLMSLRAETVQGATQALMATFLVPLMILQLIPFLFLSVVPDGRERLRDMLAAADFTRIAIIVAVVLVVIDVTLLMVGKARFRRARLILD